MFTFLYDKFTQDNMYQILSQSVWFCRLYIKKHFGVFFFGSQCRVIALSCGMQISALHCLVLSQSMRVTDGRTDRQTDRITTPKIALA